jgi:hypothetical protein
MKLIFIFFFIFLCFSKDDVDVIYSDTLNICKVRRFQEGLSCLYLDSINYIILKDNRFYFADKNRCKVIIPTSNNNLEIINEF